MDTKAILEELKGEISKAILDQYDAGNSAAFEVAGFISGIIEKKIAECGGE